MDFIEGLSKSQNKEVILVVVDKFTKYSHCIALAHPYVLESVAKDFMENIYKLHGYLRMLFQTETRCSLAGFGKWFLNN